MGEGGEGEETYTHNVMSVSDKCVRISITD